MQALHHSVFGHSLGWPLTALSLGQRRGTRAGLRRVCALIPQCTRIDQQLVSAYTVASAHTIPAGRRASQLIIQGSFSTWRQPDARRGARMFRQGGPGKLATIARAARGGVSPPGAARNIAAGWAGVGILAPRARDGSKIVA